MTTRFSSGRETLVGRGIPQTVAPPAPYTTPTIINLNAAAYAGAIVYGDDGQFYRSNGTVWISEAQQVFSTTDPGVDPLVMVVRPDLAQNATTNIGVAIAPRGNGALTAGVPDLATQGGNNRGAYAVDLQLERNSSEQVASGANSTISGGRNNKATGEYSTVGGGTSNSATGDTAAVAGGESNSATGDYSTVGGGISNVASGAYSTIPGGEYGNTRGLRGKLSYSSGPLIVSFSPFTLTDAQYGLHVLRRVGTSGSGPLTSDTSGIANATNIPVLPNRTLYAFRIRVVCVRRANGTVGDSKAWDVVGAIKRGETAANTVLLGTPTITVLGADANLGTDNTTGAIISVTADTTLGALRVNAQTVPLPGPSPVNSFGLCWVATVETTEVTY